jgi:hypothetical protein
MGSLVTRYNEAGVLKNITSKERLLRIRKSTRPWSLPQNLKISMYKRPLRPIDLYGFETCASKK